MSDYHKKLIYISEHRGMREADLILGRFARTALSSLDDVQIGVFSDLLECPDQDILTWFFDHNPTPEKFLVLMSLIRGHRIV